MKLNLIRDIDNGKSTLGRLYLVGQEDEFLCYTLENHWEENTPRVSCIPEGCYGMGTKEYGRYWDKYQLPIPILHDVPGRSQILIHPGNYPKDTLGCILVGSEKDENAVYHSRKTWKKFNSLFQLVTEIEIKYNEAD